jgi:magnesium-transporting ATPase (P-type)
MEIKLLDHIEKYKLEHVLEFNSTRKRMSVILIDDMKNVILFTKGADSIIMKRMRKQDENTPIIEKTINNLADYGSIGLRTLLLAEKIIP